MKRVYGNPLVLKRARSFLFPLFPSYFSTKTKLKGHIISRFPLQQQKINK